MPSTLNFFVLSTKKTMWFNGENLETEVRAALPLTCVVIDGPLGLTLLLLPYSQNRDDSCFLVSNTVKNQVI